MNLATFTKRHPVEAALLTEAVQHGISAKKLHSALRRGRKSWAGYIVSGLPITLDEVLSLLAEVR